MRLNIIFVLNKMSGRGAQQQLFNFVKKLCDYANVSIFTFSTNDKEFPEIFEYDKVKIISNQHPGKYNFLKFKALYDCLSRKRYDVVVTMGLGSALFFGRVTAPLCGVNIIYSILNTTENFHKFPKMTSDYFDVLNRKVNNIIPRFNRKRIYRFLPNSKELEKKVNLISKNYPVQTLHNGLLIEDFDKLPIHKPKEATKLVLNQFVGRPTILQVGALDENKNQIFTLQCIRDIRDHVPNVRFLVIGDGPKKEELKSWVALNDLRKQVIFAGQMNRMDCLYLMSKSDLLVLTSESESFPNVLLEGQASSLPVVAFNVGAASEIIEKNSTGFVVRKGDREGFKKSVIQLLLDKNKAKKMGEMGRQRAFELFNMEKKVEQLISMVEKDLSSIRITLRG
jgi:glycosyltransferase involved in cell wall biosynthesis